jgi:hypothetical protein
MALHHRDDPGEGLRHRKVVGAHDRKISGAGPVEALVERGVGTEVDRTRDELDPGVLACDFLRHLDTVVGRGVVDDQDPGIRYALGENARDAARQVAPVLVIGNDDVDARHEDYSPSCPAGPLEEAGGKGLLLLA